MPIVFADHLDRSARAGNQDTGVGAEYVREVIIVHALVVADQIAWSDQQRQPAGIGIGRAGIGQCVDPDTAHAVADVRTRLRSRKSDAIAHDVVRQVYSACIDLDAVAGISADHVVRANQVAECMAYQVQAAATIGNRHVTGRIGADHVGRDKHGGQILTKNFNPVLAIARNNVAGNLDWVQRDKRSRQIVGKCTDIASLHGQRWESLEQPIERTRIDVVVDMRGRHRNAMAHVRHRSSHRIDADEISRKGIAMPIGRNAIPAAVADDQTDHGRSRRAIAITESSGSRIRQVQTAVGGTVSGTVDYDRAGNDERSSQRRQIAVDHEYGGCDERDAMWTRGASTHQRIALFDGGTQAALAIHVRTHAISRVRIAKIGETFVYDERRGHYRHGQYHKQRYKQESTDVPDDDAQRTLEERRRKGS